MINLLIVSYLTGYLIALGIVIISQNYKEDSKKSIVFEILFFPLFSWIIVGLLLGAHLISITEE